MSWYAIYLPADESVCIGPFAMEEDAERHIAEEHVCEQCWDELRAECHNHWSFGLLTPCAAEWSAYVLTDNDLRGFDNVVSIDEFHADTPRA